MKEIQNKIRYILKKRLAVGMTQFTTEPTEIFVDGIDMATEELSTLIQQEREEAYREIFPDKNKDFQEWVMAWFKEFGKTNRSWLFDEYKTYLSQLKGRSSVSDETKPSSKSGESELTQQSLDKGDTDENR